MVTYVERRIAEEMERLYSLTGIEFERSNNGNIKSIKQKGFTVSMIRGANLEMLLKNITSTNDLIGAALDKKGQA